MRVFVTGATGFVGSAVVRELVANGHQVAGLCRAQEKAAALRDAGAEVVMGMLGQLDLLQETARGADAVVHTAFNHDFSRFVENAQEDRRAIEAMGEAIEGTDKPLIATSGLALLAENRLATEADGHGEQARRFPRASEAAAEALAARGVKATTMRLAPSVHGEGDHGFIPILIGIARQKGVSAYVGEGANRWPGVHRSDAARLYRLALEKGVEGGPYHAVDEEGVPFRALAETIGRGLGLPVQSLTADAAAEHFGFFAIFVGMDMAASSQRTRERLGWTPTGPGFLEDIGQPGYYRAA